MPALRVCPLSGISVVPGTRSRLISLPPTLHRSNGLPRPVGRFDKLATKAYTDGNGAGVGMDPDLKAAIDKFISENKVVVFMKGHKDAPKCGFSNTVCQILKSMDVPFESVDILQSDDIRQGMKAYSMWPTFPQVYIDGEFFGGCDITVEAFRSGELAEVVERAFLS